MNDKKLNEFFECIPYNKEQFNDSQISEIDEALKVYDDEEYLTLDEIKIIANPEYDSDKMRNMRLDFENGYTIRDVKKKYYV